MAFVHALGIEPGDTIIVDNEKQYVVEVAFDVFKSVLFCDDEYGDPTQFTFTHDEEVELA